MSSVDPGDGYRLLVKGEPIREDVTYYVKGKWHKMSTDTNVGEPWNDVDFFPMRVPKEIADNAGVLVTTGGPYVAIEAHRAALAEIERLKAELEAVKQPQPSPEPELEWFDLTPFNNHQMRVQTDYAYYLPHDQSGEWRHTSAVFSVSTVGELKKLGYTKCRCLLKDAPPELVAMASKPAEDPDEWVTQDRVRQRDCDQRRWVNHDGSARCEWDDVMIGELHGWKNGPARLELRCRRRDLPPMPEQKLKTETEREVLLYWYDGNVVGRYADCPPTDQSFIPLIVRDGKVFIETETREVNRG